MTENKFKILYKDIVRFEKILKRDINYFKREARKLYKKGSKSDLLNQKHSKELNHLDDVVFGGIF